MSLRVQVNCTFFVTCPHCGAALKYEPIMDSDGDRLYEHFLKVFFDKPRDCLPVITCTECDATIEPWSFFIPGSMI